MELNAILKEHAHTLIVKASYMLSLTLQRKAVNYTAISMLLDNPETKIVDTAGNELKVTEVILIEHLDHVTPYVRLEDHYDIYTCSISIRGEVVINLNADNYGYGKREGEFDIRYLHNVADKKVLRVIDLHHNLA